MTVAAEARARPARVIGAGLSGLAAAWHLAERGFDVSVVEQASRPGGLIGTVETPHGPVETAANAFVWDATVAEWFQRLDLHPIFPLAASRRRYILRNGVPRRWPLSIGESLTLAGRLSVATLTRSRAASNGESMAAWGTRVIGTAATRWLLGPALQGIYAAAPDRLSARVVLAARRRGPRKMATPAGGMGQFTTRLYERLRDRRVRFEFERHVDRIDIEAPTIVATNAPNAARLIAPHTAPLSRAIAAVKMSPLITVTMFFEPHPDDLHGFGLLFPSRSGVHALGVLFNADIFDQRGSVRSETWIVGDREAAMTTWDDDRVFESLAADRQFVTGRNDVALSRHITRWPQAIPVYDTQILDVAELQSTLPAWLGVTGNYLGRIGVAALLDQARIAAERIALNNS